MEHRRLNNLNKKTQIGWLNDMMEYLFSVVQGRLGARNIASGTINQGNIIESPNLDSTIGPGDCVTIDTESGKWIKYQGGIGIVDSDKNIVTSGACELDGLEQGRSIFVDENGHITLEKITEYNKGICITESLAYINTNGIWGIPKAYQSAMKVFRAYPYTDTKIRLTIKLPADADGAYIRYSTSGPYDGSGLSWGTELVNITDDADCHGANKYYIASNLPNAVVHYFHAFPYKSTLTNAEDNASNDAKARSGGMWSEYDMDHHSGSTLEDTAGNRNGTLYNATFLEGDVGDAVYTNGTNTKIVLDTTAALFPKGHYTHKGYCLMARIKRDGTEGASRAIFGKACGASSVAANRGGHEVLTVRFESNRIYDAYRDEDGGGSNFDFTTGLVDTDEYFFIALNIKPNRTYYIRINDQIVHTGTNYQVPDRLTGNYAPDLAFYINYYEMAPRGLYYYWRSYVDQPRIMNRYAEDYELDAFQKENVV